MRGVDRAGLLGLTALVLAGVVVGPVARAAEVGVAPSTRKILADTAFPTAGAAAVAAARGEWEGFQLAIRGGGGLTAVDVALSDLVGPGGATIGADRARLYREHYVEVTNASDFGVTFHEREVGFYPDPLIPLDDPWGEGEAGAPFDLAADEVGVVFVDLYVPHGSEPGEYTGTATVTAAGEVLAEVPLTLTVWAFDLPADKTVATAFRYPFDDNIRAFHGGPGEEPDAGYAPILDRYHELLHEHRIDPTDFDADVEFTFDGDGILEPIDWAAYDAAMAPWLDGGKFADGVGVTRFNMRYFRPGRGTGELTADQYQQAAVAFAEHLDAMGWWERAYIYASDEPWLDDPDEEYAQIAADADLLIEASELWRRKTLVTSPYDERVAGRVGIWCPVTPMYDAWWWVWDPQPGWDTYTERLSLGEQLWFYACNANTPPYAGYDIDSAIGHEPRIVKWGAWYERASGFLYWRTAYWVDDDPWNVLLNLENFGEAFARNGDGLLLYPGDHDGTAGGQGSPAWLSLDGPIGSYRLKQIRDGLEDWEMFRLAVDLGAEEFARAQVERAYTRFGDFFLEDCAAPNHYCPDDQPWTLDEHVLADARAQVAAKIQHLLHPDDYPDPEAEEAPPGDEPPADEAPDGCRCALQADPVSPVVPVGLLILAGMLRRPRR